MHYMVYLCVMPSACSGRIPQVHSADPADEILDFKLFDDEDDGRMMDHKAFVRLH